MEESLDLVTNSVHISGYHYDVYDYVIWSVIVQFLVCPQFKVTINLLELASKLLGDLNSFKEVSY